MKKTLFFKTDDQLNFISKHKLECDCEVGTTTYFVQIIEDTSKIFMLVSKKDDVILKKWIFENDMCLFFLKPNKDESNEVDCYLEDGMDCVDICNNNNINCFLCEKKMD